MSSNVTKTIVRINFVFLGLLILALLVSLVLLNADVDDFGPVTIIGSMILCGAIAYACLFLNWNLKLFKEIRYQEVIDPDLSEDSVKILILGVLALIF